ncbi:hypothetical protein OHS33_09070 [Streptomyces sp. NBC_00536]|uniref:hypothetical protein n=1 Tax=Streptomyces sp. NBC_00536 TaxID=2975769 RepID=UPI002E80E19B|nr:hypothetical protein [Streptomyces sp. NBC_00536]WUC78474.1 hypothetical protein OHS33_09070 [Streptomyces sp. NBC_00536]
MNGFVITQEHWQEHGQEHWRQHWYEATGEEFATAGHEVRIPNFPEAEAWLGSVRAAPRLRGLPRHDTAAEKVFAGTGGGTLGPFFAPELRAGRSAKSAAGALPGIPARNQWPEG